MANPTWTVKCLSVATDGNNIFVEISVSDGTTTMPPIRPVFDAGTSASTITAYMQAIANTHPVNSASIGALVNTTVTG